MVLFRYGQDPREIKVPTGPAPGFRRLGDAHITLSSTPGRGTIGTVEIDGSQIEGGINFLVLTAGIGQPPTLELSGAIAEFDSVQVDLKDVRYVMSRRTREVLIEMGWTPPKEEE